MRRQQRSPRQGLLDPEQLEAPAPQGLRPDADTDDMRDYGHLSKEALAVISEGDRLGDRPGFSAWADEVVSALVARREGDAPLAESALVGPADPELSSQALDR